MTLGRANVDVYNPDFGQDLFARTLQIHEDYYLSDTVIIRKCAHSAYENYYTSFIAITLRASRLKNKAKNISPCMPMEDSSLAPISYLVTYERFETLMYCDPPPKPAIPWICITDTYLSALLSLS